MIGKLCKDLSVEVLWICCVDVDVSIYIVVIVFCIIGVSGYNIMVLVLVYFMNFWVLKKDYLIVRKGKNEYKYKNILYFYLKFL